MQPCDKGPVIDLILKTQERIADHFDKQDHKLDLIHDSLTVLAVQKERIDGLFTTMEKHDNRLSKLEATPRKILWWILGIFGGTVSAVVAGIIIKVVFWE